MNLNKYDCIVDETYASFAFNSVGPRGAIQKIVSYRRMRTAPNGMAVYNLSFGDWDEGSQMPNDTVTSNNLDRDKVLGTVASTVMTFVRHHEKCAIYAKGSSPARTRLYQMGIHAYWNEIQELFHVFGLLKGEWVEFKPGWNFEAFLVVVK